jgi:hypothetical protein
MLPFTLSPDGLGSAQRRRSLFASSIEEACGRSGDWYSGLIDFTYVSKRRPWSEKSTAA